MGFEAQDYTDNSLLDARADLTAQGQLEWFSTDEMIQRATEDSDLTADEISEISAEILYDVSDVCERSHELCEDLKDQIFISRLKKWIVLSVNASGMMDQALFEKHFNCNVADLIDSNNGWFAARLSGLNSLEVWDMFTAVLDWDDITFFNWDNEAEFKYNVNTKEISRDDLWVNDLSDDTSVQDIDLEVDKVIEEWIKPFSWWAREALLNHEIKKDLSKLTDEEIITLSAEIWMKEFILRNLRDGEYIIAHHVMSDEDIMKIAGLLSVENPDEFLGKYNSIKAMHIAPSVLIQHDATSVSFVNNKREPYWFVNRIQ